MKIIFLNFQAIQFILSSPRLMVLCVLPILISFFVMILLTIGIYWGFEHFLIAQDQTISHSWFVQKVIDLLQYFHHPMIKWPLIGLLFLVILWFGFGVLHGVILTPFLEMISFETEKELRTQIPENPWHRGLLSSILFSLWLAITKIFLLFLGFMASLIFPPIAILNFILMAWYCGTEAVDSCMSRNLFTVSNKMGFILKHKIELTLLGSVSSVMLMIPLLNVIQPIVATTAATFYFIGKDPRYEIKEKYKNLVYST